MCESILIVDDDTVTRRLMRMLLELSGFVVDEASNGLEALEKVEHQRPDAMILDVMMPRLDGIATCKQLRANPDTADLFILMHSSSNHHDLGLAAGANMYMEKSMDVNHIVDVLKSNLRV